MMKQASAIPEAFEQMPAQPRPTCTAMLRLLAVLSLWGLVSISTAIAQEPAGDRPEVLNVALVAAVNDSDSAGQVFEWTIINADTEEVIFPEGNTAEVSLTLAPGKFDVIVVSDRWSGEQSINVSASGPDRFVVDLVESKAEFGIQTAESVAAGSMVEISWIGPNLDSDYLFIVDPMVEDNRYYDSAKRALKASNGPRGSLPAPAVPGTYEIRYYSLDNGSVLLRRPLQVTQPQVEIRYPQSIPAGSMVEFSWSGPAFPEDRIFIASPTVADNMYYTNKGTYHDVKDGPDGAVIAPADAGEHEIRYFSGAWGTPLARFPITVTEAEVTIDAPRVVTVGTEFEFNWTGPAANGDFLFLTKPDLEAHRYYTRGEHKTSDGPAGTFTAPTEPGNYEIRYFSKPNATVLARRAVVVR